MERLVDAVLGDPGLWRRLLAVPERAAFVAEVVAVAGERGIEVTGPDVEAAIAAARRTWLQRWV